MVTSGGCDVCQGAEAINPRQSCLRWRHSDLPVRPAIATLRCWGMSGRWKTPGDDAPLSPGAELWWQGWESNPSDQAYEAKRRTGGVPAAMTRPETDGCS
jgi:hypothetical protein